QMTFTRLDTSLLGSAVLAGCIAGWLAVPTVHVSAQTSGTPGNTVTFAKDIAPILQRSCQNCHRPDSVAPMSLLQYAAVRPYARAIKQRTVLATTQRGVMPPWFIDKTVGIQDYEEDISLTDKEKDAIARWVDGGAPLGNPADLPPARQMASTAAWQ